MSYAFSKKKKWNEDMHIMAYPKAAFELMLAEKIKPVSIAHIE